jgi:cyclopropane fatty-acyl-phospholipid synthase-like methyltransferase
MSEYSASINEQYGRKELGDIILDGFISEGFDVDALTLDDLSRIDQLHAGGRDATRVLANLAGLKPGMKVLDIGSGLGGPARTLAADFGCQVTGLDITEAYVAAAQMLTERVGLSDRVSFRVGNALDLDYEDGTFDAVWTQNAIMNIKDKGQVFREVHRVLRSRGVLALEALMAGSNEETLFPVFWANSPAVSFLSTSAIFRRMMAGTGFKELTWNDVTEHSIERGRKQQAASGNASPALGLHLFISDLPRRASNTLRGWENGTYEDICAVFTV